MIEGSDGNEIVDVGGENREKEFAILNDGMVHVGVSVVGCLCRVVNVYVSATVLLKCVCIVQVVLRDLCLLNFSFPKFDSFSSKFQVNKKQTLQTQEYKATSA